MRLPVLRRVPGSYTLVLLIVAAYLLIVRTWHVSDSFLMLRDQIRDWRFALGPLSGLPLTGTPSTAGGSSLGPIFYWLLWIIRHVVGPWTGYLPHAGAIGLSIVHTAADLLLLYAIGRRTGSLWLAVGVTLLSATASHDLSISSTIWNPTVSIAFSKVTVALLLLDTPARPWWWLVATTVSAWWAVQAHSAALFIAAPALGYFVVRAWVDVGAIRAWQSMRTIAEVILVLQLPFIYNAFTHTSEATPIRALGGAGQAIADPSSLRLGPSTMAMTWSLAQILFAPWSSVWWMVLIFAAAAVVAVRARRDLALLSTTILPLICTAFGFALWQGNYDEYWYLPVAPCAALTLGLACTAWRPRAAAVVIVVVVLLMQPGRITYSHTRYRMPEYRALARGAREIFRQTQVIRRIDTTFRPPAFTEVAFPYEAMGGRLVPEAGFDATIDADGHVRFTPVR